MLAYPILVLISIGMSVHHRVKFTSTIAANMVYLSRINKGNRNNKKQVSRSGRKKKC